jgi:hypothetical protein
MLFLQSQQTLYAARAVARLGAQKRRKTRTLSEIKPLEYLEERAASVPR